MPTVDEVERLVLSGCLALGLVGLGCSDSSVEGPTSASGETTLGDGDGDASGGDGDASGDGDGDASGDGDGDASGDGDGDPAGDGDGDTGASSGVKFDIGQDIDFGHGGGNVDECVVNDNGDAVGECEEQALPDSFEPNVEWTYDGNGMESQSVVTPLVGNLTDDDDNGVIDLCDVPDVVIVAFAQLGGLGHIHVIDGATGEPHYVSETTVDFSVTPALGDIDNDGEMEIVTTNNMNLVALDSDGSLLWTGAPFDGYIGAVALADLDNDGDVEIFGDRGVYDHMGQLLWQNPNPIALYPATTAADMDDDGDLEVVFGNSVLHHDGSVMWYTPAVTAGFPQVADLDDDGEPEVLVTSTNGLSLIDTDGTVIYNNLTPTNDPPGGNNWNRPAAVHDMDGDLLPEYAMSSRSNYTAYEADAEIIWSAPVLDSSGIAAGTAFDFLGDGIAEAMYADETNMFIFDGEGQVLLQTPRSSATGIEYPIVADADNDGSAEIIVISMAFGNQQSPLAQSIGDIEDRWIQARRIWNQHAYHVTNVREDGVIPQWEAPNWETFNTFRTNAQIEGGGACIPPPPG